MSYTGLAIQYLVVPRRNFSSPPSSHPRPPPLPPNPYSSAPPPICLETFITLQEGCVSNLQEAVRGGRGTRGGEGVVERRRGLNIRESDPPHTRALLNSTLSSVKSVPLRSISKCHTQSVFSLLNSSPWFLLYPPK